MKSTGTDFPPFLGADPTDRYAIRCRPIDVCGLVPTNDGRLEAKFWLWFWDPAPKPIDVRPIMAELRVARCSMLDGPQGLARPFRTMRECDRASAAAGKVPDCRPMLSQPFGGFVCSSLDLFSALAEAGLIISPASAGTGVGEVYPGAIWPRLARRHLPKKGTPEGVEVRSEVLRCLGVVGLPARVNHDQLDAALGAVVAAAAAGAIPGVRVEALGDALYRDEAGALREGPMIFPLVEDPTLLARLGVASVHRHAVAAEPDALPTLPTATGSPTARAQSLLRWLVDRAVEGHPHVCTYAWAYTYLTGRQVTKWSQAYSKQVIDIARTTARLPVPGLGEVHLDAFIVLKSSGEPSSGYWGPAAHDAARWREVLGGANTLNRDAAGPGLAT